MEVIVRKIVEASGKVREISEASKVQSKRIQQINVAIAVLEKVTQDNAALVGTGGAIYLSVKDAFEPEVPEPKVDRKALECKRMREDLKACQGLKDSDDRKSCKEEFTERHRKLNCEPSR